MIMSLTLTFLLLESLGRFITCVTANFRAYRFIDPLSRFQHMGKCTRYNLSADVFFCWCERGVKSSRLKKIVALPQILINLADFRPLIHFHSQVS